MPAPSPVASAEETIRQLRLLCELAQRISLVTEEPEMYRLTARYARELFPFVDRCSVALLQGEGERLALFALDGTVGSIPLGATLPREGTMLGETIRERAPVLVAGEGFVQSTLLDVAMLRQQGLRASMDAPLITGGRIIGTLNTASNDADAYHEGHRDVLLQMATLLSAGIEHWRMVAELRKVVAETQKKAEASRGEAEVLRAIMRGTSGEIGAGFLQSLVRHLAGALGVRYALLGEPVPGTAEARTVAFWDGAEFRSSVRYDLSGTPCGEVLSGRVCYHPRGALELFPGAALVRELGVESYVGVPLRTQNGEALGHLVVMDTRPMAEDEGGDEGRALQVVRIFAARALAELERLRTERERERLVSDLSRATALIETTTDFVCLVGLSGQVLYINPAGMRLIGQDGDPTCFSARDIVAGEVSASFDEVADAVRAAGFWAGPRYFRHRDGHLIPVEQVVTLVRDAQGEPLCLGSIAHDMTEQRRTLLELQQAKEGAEAASRAKGAFLAKMSHELRTPLNAILGFTQLLCREQDLLPAQREYLQIIRQSGEHLLSLINDTLEMSKIEAGRLLLRPEVFDLEELLTGVEAMLRLRAEDKGLKLRYERGPGLPRLCRTDAGKLRQVLLNLLGNAVKFTTVGEVTLRACGLPMSGEAGPGGRAVRLRFEVEDSGPGIAREELVSLFEPFYQAEAGRKAQEGTGLGLPISQQFVRLLGGDIEVRSEPQKGSCFRFTVQAELPEPEIGAAAQTSSAFRAGRRVVGLQAGQPLVRILVVEDRWQNRLLLCKLLRDVGLTVLEADNGLEGIAQFQQHQPHLIWMDMAMPVMDGREATRRIRSSPRGRSTVIIALTASAFEEEREAVLADGCDDFVRKPFAEDEIFGKMEQHLGLRFRYAEEPARKEEPPGTLRPEDLRSLPPAWRAALHQAAVQLDPDQVEILLEEAEAEAPAVAEGIRALLRSFAFDQIQKLTEREGT